ncbi:MAG: polysaccharide deacetylase family protein [Pseudomonadota bacterium]
MNGRKTACISIDLDSVECYYGIHGLNPPHNVRAIHFSKGLRRFLGLFDELNIKSTLFAVGEDLRDETCGRILAEAAQRGHEPANHTWSHPYNLTRLPDTQKKHQIRRAHEAIAQCTGREPVGFRAPGYHINGRLRAMLRESGYRYDASLLPSPPYYFAKSAVIALSALRGRRSRSIIGGSGMILSPTLPYRSGGMYWTMGDDLLEIPCSVVTPLRIPFIGTTMTVFSDRVIRLLMCYLEQQPFLSIELHAIDLMDSAEDGFESLARFQPDAAIPLEEKREKIRAVLSMIVNDFGFEPMTLEQAARLVDGR